LFEKRRMAVIALAVPIQLEEETERKLMREKQEEK
jgi:hypothetical protein